MRNPLIVHANICGFSVRSSAEKVKFSVSCTVSETRKTQSGVNEGYALRYISSDLQTQNVPRIHVRTIFCSLVLYTAHRRTRQSQTRLSSGVYVGHANECRTILIGDYVAFHVIFGAKSKTWRRCT